MIETKRCPECGDGNGWVGVPIGTPNRPPTGTERCSTCNPKPIDQVADAENARAFSDATKAKRRGDRAKWWA